MVGGDWIWVALVVTISVVSTVAKNESPRTNAVEANELFYLAKNRITVVCPDAPLGSKGVVNGVEYTKRSEEELRALAVAGTTDESQWSLMTTTCTSGITNMSGLVDFRSNGLDYFDFPFGSFNEDISTWDVSSCVDVSRMFYGASSFNQPISAWNMSQVQSMKSMFAGAYAFNQSIGNWNTSRWVLVM